MTLAADNLIISFEKYIIMTLVIDHEYHMLHVQSQFIWSNTESGGKICIRFYCCCHLQRCSTLF